MIGLYENSPRQIQRKLLNSAKCGNDLRKHDEGLPCLFELTRTKIAD